MAFGFLKKHLHRQIYATILATLFLVVVVTGAIIFSTQQGKFERELYGMSARLIYRALPPASATVAEQAAALNELGGGSQLDLSLFDRERKLIASYGKAIPPPYRKRDAKQGMHEHLKRWHRHKGVRGFGPVWQIQLEDGRWFAIDARKRPGAGLILRILFILAGITLAIGLGAYPFVRKLTGRLEKLQQSVNDFGDGNLSSRADIKGTDEVAELANSFNDMAGKVEGLINSNRQLLANASHELRTPLARVRLGVEMVKERPDAKRQAALEQDIAELDELIDEILLMSRLDTGAKLTKHETFDLLALASEECARYEGCTLDGESAEISGDLNLMRRLIRNLLDNAEKHGEPPIVMHIKSGENVTLTITDAGNGIPADHLSSVFEPFQRAPGKQNVPGYGLGLALVKQIAQAHNGSVAIVEPDKDGFSIAITIPAA